MSSTQSISVLDLQDFRTGGNLRQIFVSQLGQALEDIGFFALTNHGVDRSLIQAAYRVSQAFFELPTEVKQRYEDPALKGQRGFTSFGRSMLKIIPSLTSRNFGMLGESCRPVIR